MIHHSWKTLSDQTMSTFWLQWETSKTKKQDADIIGVEKCYTSRELGGVSFVWIFIEIKQTNLIEIVCVA